MFDPTIYENMKIVIEGAVYDLDLAGEILVTNRSDRVELSTMSRAYSIQFKLLGLGDVMAELSLAAATEDLASEILEKTNLTPGCTLQITFQMKIGDVDEDCPAVQHLLFDIWGNSCTLSQRLFFIYGKTHQAPYSNEICLDFGRKFGESIINDIPSMLEHIVLSITRLNEIGG
ncbi:MAG: hypothetical protein WD469_08770 [Paenibacillaceae bacterium]